MEPPNLAKLTSESAGAEFQQRVGMKASAKLIQSLSAGIYRTPANALKELVNNAFDADAKNVYIKMDLEKMDQIQVYDDGVGIDANSFVFSIGHIGGSLKRATGENTPMGRPLIGRIGIGLLAVGQACRKFTMVSTRRDSSEGLRAEVDLSPFFEKGAVVRDLAELTIGNVVIKKFPHDQKSSGTIVTMESLEPSFREKMAHARTSNLQPFPFSAHKPGEAFQEFVEWVYANDVTSIERLTPYERFLWDLGLCVPVAYLPDGPVKDTGSRVIKKLKARLQKYNFSVHVNGMEIFKPILLPPPRSEKGPRFEVYDIEITGKLSDNRPVELLGYYYHQVSNIKPLELRGVLPRVRNVAIGGYENSIFQVIRQKPVVSHQLSGELYVDEGLDQALNIDRNSFFENDQGYVAVRHTMAGLLQESPNDDSFLDPVPGVTGVAVKVSTGKNIRILTDINARQLENAERKRKRRTTEVFQMAGPVAEKFGFSDCEIQVGASNSRTLATVDRSGKLILKLPGTLTGSVAVRAQTIQLLTLVGACAAKAKDLQEFQANLQRYLEMYL